MQNIGIDAKLVEDAAFLHAAARMIMINRHFVCMSVVRGVSSRVPRA